MIRAAGIRTWFFNSNKEQTAQRIFLISRLIKLKYTPFDVIEIHTDLDSTMALRNKVRALPHTALIWQLTLETEIRFIITLLFSHGRNSYKSTVDAAQFVTQGGICRCLLHAWFFVICRFSSVLMHTGLMMLDYVCTQHHTNL